LRRAWTFDGSDRLPAPEAIAALLLISDLRNSSGDRRHRVARRMELDLGGIGKEYAVDRTYELLQQAVALPSQLWRRLARQRSTAEWVLAGRIERPDQQQQASLILHLEHGALATSGDSRRFVLRDGIVTASA